MPQCLSDSASSAHYSSEHFSIPTGHDATLPHFSLFRLDVMGDDGDSGERTSEPNPQSNVELRALVPLAPCLIVGVEF